jgi:hypothetical protein
VTIANQVETHAHYELKHALIISLVDQLVILHTRAADLTFSQQHSTPKLLIRLVLFCHLGLRSAQQKWERANTRKC